VEHVVLVAAEERELAGFRRRLAGVRRLDWPLATAVAGERGGVRFLLVANGAGARLAAEALEIARQRTQVGAVVSTGYCGGLHPGLRPGQVFVASEVRALEGDQRYPARLPRAPQDYFAGILLSAGRVIGSEQEKRVLRQQGGDAVDMEAAAVARCAAAWGVPFYSIRAVTDTAEESFRCDLNAARLADGRISYSKLLLAAAARPAERAPELWRLWRRARLAAEALGEFLARCKF
jgi:nucleoside phosphorylase